MVLTYREIKCGISCSPEKSFIVHDNHLHFLMNKKMYNKAHIANVLTQKYSFSFLFFIFFNCILRLNQMETLEYGNIVHF